jgi:hypothetical protein
MKILRTLEGDEVEVGKAYLFNNGEILTVKTILDSDSSNKVKVFFDLESVDTKSTKLKRIMSATRVNTGGCIWYFTDGKYCGEEKDPAFDWHFVRPVEAPYIPNVTYGLSKLAVLERLCSPRL